MLNSYSANVMTETLNQQSAFSDLKCPFNPDIYNTIHKIKCCKYTGADDLDPYLLQISSQVICHHAAHIFNQSFLTGIVPSPWKSAFVVL